MRLKIECELEDNIVSVDYNRKILSFFKNSLENYNKEIQMSYYENPKEKEMSFACFFPMKKIEKDNIYLIENTFKIFITFNSIIDGIHFYNGFLNSKKNKIKFKLGNNSFYIKNIIRLKEKRITEEIAIFKTLSPIVIRENISKTKEWFYFLDDKGIEILKRNLLFSLKEKFSEEKINMLEIIPVNVKKTIVNFYNIKFPTTKGIFIIKGDKEILEYFYKSGFSSKKSSGFGMLELIK